MHEHFDHLFCFVLRQEKVTLNVKVIILYLNDILIDPKLRKNEFKHEYRGVQTQDAHYLNQLCCIQVCVKIRNRLD